MTNLYLSINILFALTLPWFFLLKGFSPQVRVWVCRLLLALCIVLPLLVRILPGKAPSLPRSSQSFVERITVHEENKFVAANKQMTKGQKDQRFTEERFDPITVSMLIGLGLCLAFYLSEFSQLRRLLRNAAPYRRKGRVKVLISADVSSALSFRSFHYAYVVLPVTLLSNRRMLNMAMAHEGIHHRRWDCWSLYLTGLLRAVFACNPFVHIMLKRLQTLEEFACDSDLLSYRRFSPYEYAGCLRDLTVAAQRSIHAMPLYVRAMVSPRRSQSLLGNRIFMISKMSDAVSFKSRLLSVLSCVCLLGLACCTTLGFRPERVYLSRVQPEFQNIVQEEVKKIVKTESLDSAAALIIDIQSSDVLAFAEVGNGKEASLLERQIPMGGIAIPLIMAVGLDQGAFKSETTFDCRGPIDLGGKSYKDIGAWNDLTPAQIVANQSFIGAYRMAQSLGSSRLEEGLSSLGLTRDVTKDSKTFIESIALHPQYVATPLEIARAYGKANSPTGHLSQENRATFLEALAMSRSGNIAAQSAYILTAQKGKKGEGEWHYKTTSTFVGFESPKNPRYVLYILTEKGFQSDEKKPLKAMFQSITDRIR